MKVTARDLKAIKKPWSYSMVNKLPNDADGLKFWVDTAALQ